MILHIVDRNYNALTTVDTDSADGVQVTNVKRNPVLSNGLLLNSISFDVIKNTEESALIDVAKYVVYQTNDGQNVCCAITSTDDETETERPVSADDLGMELLNGSATIFTSEKAQTVDYYVSRELYDSGWVIGDNELGNDIKVLVDTSQSETPLARLQRIATAFGCEMTFTLDFQNLKIKRKKLNIYHSIGADRSSTVFYAGRDVISIRKSMNTDNLVTALEDTNHGFDDLSIGDGRFCTRKGESVVYDRESNALYGRGNTSEERFSGFITGTFASTGTAPIDAYNQTVAELTERSQPAFSADVDLLFQDGDINVGDQITFVDEDYNPALRVKARISALELYPDRSGTNKATIVNAQMLKSMISSDLLALQGQIQPDDSVYAVQLTTDNGQGFIEGQAKTTKISATVTKDGVDITSSLQVGDLEWFKVDQDGNHDTDWENNQLTSISSVSVTEAEVDSVASIRCALTLFSNRYVQAVYFLNGLRDVARKVLRLQGPDTITSVHISDTHYATDSIARDDLENYSRSNNHVKNVVELSRFIDLDYIVHNGDAHDGSTANKDIALSNYREIISTLGLAKCPYFITWGNHDNNCWGDSRTNSINKTIRNYKPSKTATGLHGKGRQMLSNAEMYEVATRPSTIFGIHENADDKLGYYYYDVPGKPMRVIVLNPQDVPDTLDSDGYLKYQTLNVAGYRQKQIEWFYQTLLSTPADTTVAIYQHFGFGYRYSTTMAYVPYNYELIDGIIDTFVSGGTYTGSYSANPDFAASISTDFKGQRGKLAFLAHGHFHNDRINTDSNNIHSYSVGCSVSRPKKDQADRPLGELQEDLWDVVVVNTATQHVNLVRFGAGKDQEFDY